MIGSGNSFIGSENRDAPFFQTIKCLGAGNFVDEVPVDIENIRPVFDGFHHMSVPDFVEKCFCFQNIIFKFFLRFFTPLPLLPHPKSLSQGIGT
jgi:hypothetical protein